ncbi:MAG: Uma2 family endonuclease [Thiofilum sp.]|uniref:Uma2 family endonuclease n=1 Tax=Thiofilum sp. TaxID=2212733 RepID=UPI0025CBA671|nr:Uma2 family endonuclease [Thiofilum sp.]MBK8454333.1 Uma2 family endonuclease [Thiofilum sp.]
MSTAEKLAEHYTASPSRLHQQFVLKLATQIDRYLDGKPCDVYIAPFDVRLPRQNEADDKIDTTVQPDIAVICDPSKLDDKGCRGAPDWIIEVISPSSAIMDMEKKLRLYERHGVKTYWIIHPTDQWLMVYRLGPDGRYGHYQMLALTDPTPVDLFPDLTIEWAFLQKNEAT